MWIIREAFEADKINFTTMVNNDIDSEEIIEEFRQIKCLKRMITVIM